MKHLKKFILFENEENRPKIYGVFIHNSYGHVAIGLFPEASALGLVRILEDRFGMDGDDVTGAFGPLDVSKKWTIFDDGSDSGEFNITTSEYSKDLFEDSYQTKKLLQNLGSFYHPDGNGKFISPEDLFEEWYGENDYLNSFDPAWQ